jgi:hypothetical protein
MYEIRRLTYTIVTQGLSTIWMLMVLAALVLASANIAAASCPAPGPVDASYRGANLVFVGEVVSIDPASGPTRSGVVTRVRFRIIELFKGVTPANGDLELQPSSEEFPYEVGQRVLVYAVRGSTGWSTACTRTKKLSASDTEVAIIRGLADPRSGPGVVDTVGVSIEQSSIVGCVSDNTGQMLLGTTVTAKSRTDQRTAKSASNGCYELKELPPGSYRVTARLTGFDNVTRDRVEVRRSSVTRLDLRTQASPICECVRLGGTLAELAAGADAVLYVRLKDSEPVQSTPQGYYRHGATVLRAVKQAAGARTSAVVVLQNQRSGTPLPYDVGQELVAFLKSSGSPPSHAFTIVNDEPGLAVPTGSHTPSIAFLVQDGRVQQAPAEFSRYVGMWSTPSWRSCGFCCVASDGAVNGPPSRSRQASKLG